MNLLDRIRKTAKKRREKVDPDSLTAKLNFGNRPLTLHEQVQMLVRSESFTREMDRLGNDTEEEANDFDVPDEVELKSPHEYTEMQEDEDMRTLAAGDPSRRRKVPKKKPRAKPEVDEEPEEGTSSDE